MLAGDFQAEDRDPALPQRLAGKQEAAGQELDVFYAFQRRGPDQDPGYFPGLVGVVLEQGDRGQFKAGVLPAVGRSGNYYQLGLALAAPGVARFELEAVGPGREVLEVYLGRGLFRKLYFSLRGLRPVGDLAEDLLQRGIAAEITPLPAAIVTGRGFLEAVKGIFGRPTLLHVVQVHQSGAH